ncbi:hypothetical protein HK104_004064 [Borealophlyctis nickersoniae]|nr:hypothetical protein HK104_004064 [Borealophlyctis nickersoniae]
MMGDDEDTYHQRIAFKDLLADAWAERPSWGISQLNKVVEGIKSQNSTEHIFEWIKDALEELEHNLLNVFQRRNILDLLDRILDESAKERDPQQKRFWDPLVKMLRADSCGLLHLIVEMNDTERPNANFQPVLKFIEKWEMTGEKPHPKSFLACPELTEFRENMTEADKRDSYGPVEPPSFSDADRKRFLEAMSSRIEGDREKSKLDRERFLVVPKSHRDDFDAEFLVEWDSDSCFEEKDMEIIRQENVNWEDAMRAREEVPPSAPQTPATPTPATPLSPCRVPSQSYPPNSPSIHFNQYQYPPYDHPQQQPYPPYNQQYPLSEQTYYNSHPPPPPSHGHRAITHGDRWGGADRFGGDRYSKDRYHPYRK